MANSLPGSPIVGYYNEEKEDFEEHNKIIEIKGGKVTLKPTTKPYGFVDLNAKVWFQWFLDEDGITREYLVTEGWLWTGQFPECQRILEEGNNQSMELSDDPRYLDAYWTNDINGNREFFIINEAIISKLCILGENVEPCFEGANITAPKIEFSLEDSFKQELFSMINEIKSILNEGGTTNVITDEAKKEFTADGIDGVCDKCGKPIDKCECGKDEYKKDEEEKKKEEETEEEDKGAEEEKDTKTEDEDKDDKKKKEYNLEEIAEYVKLKDKFEELTNEFNKVSANAEILAAELDNLKEFKAEVDKKEKQKMIDSFYMLSDEDKKEVIDNIDSYSLEDIEAKLSIICVRNKVSFNLEEDSDKKDDPITYNLDGVDSGANDNTPEWLKAVKEYTVAEN